MAKHRVKVTHVHHWNSGLFSFKVERPISFRFRAGEFVMLGLDDAPMRAYSLVNPTWADELEFLSIAVPDGPLTSKLVNIKVGDEILLASKTTGTLVTDALLPGGSRLHLLGTGTGLAPWMSLIREPDVYDMFEKVIVQHTVRERKDLAYRELLERHLAGDPIVQDEALVQLYYDRAVTRSQHPKGRTGTRDNRRITDRLLDGSYPTRDIAEKGLDPEVDRFMICGSINMTRETGKILEGMGFTEGSLQSPGHYVVERAFVG